MNGFSAIFRREFRAYFSTPIAVVFLTVFLVLNGFFTFRLGNFFEAGQADLRSFFLWHPWLYLFIAPAVSMRLWAEEKKSGSVELLLTLPVSLPAAMLGKFFAAWAFLGIGLLLTFPMLLTVGFLGDPDWGVIVAGYVGSFLMAGAYLALGSFVSAATKNQIISFVIATAFCLLLILIGFEPVVGFLNSVLPEAFVEELANLSFPYHFEAIQRGVLDLRDLLYFLSLIGVSLASGMVILERSKAD
jgi:ABC-2 type transport system permease protein